MSGLHERVVHDLLMAGSIAKQPLFVLRRDAVQQLRHIQAVLGDQIVAELRLSGISWPAIAQPALHSV
jgi:hypothetical protein